MNKYKILNEDLIKKYSVEVIKFFDDEKNLICKEIGDGNLNNVFKIVDNETNKSLIIKQALPYARTSVEMKLTSSRCKIEAMAIKTQEEYIGDMVPKVYYYDEDLCAMSMEDLSDYEVLRNAMMNQTYLPKLANQASKFFSNTLIKSSDICLNTKDKKDQVSKFTNKDLCDLTEELVLTQLSYNCKRNKIDKNLFDYVNDNIFNNENLKLEMAKLKHKFMTSTQALLHGDCHSGSIFVTKDKIKFFDTEFAFYGPMGFDVGMFLANLIMNSCYQEINKFDGYNEYVMNTIVSFIDEFKQEFIKCFTENANEYYSKQLESFKYYYLEEILKDTAGYCGCEMIRRTIGSSHVKEMDEYKCDDLKNKAQIKNISMAVKLILNQGTFTCGEDYKSLLITNHTLNHAN